MPAKGKTVISKEKKAKAVAMIGVFGTQLAVARQEGISHSVISRAKNDPEIAQMALLAKAELADKIQLGVQIGIDSIIADASNAKFGQANQLKSLIESMQILRGEATSITQTLPLEEKRERVLELLRGKGGIFEANSES